MTKETQKSEKLATKKGAEIKEAKPAEKEAEPVGKKVDTAKTKPAEKEVDAVETKPTETKAPEVKKQSGGGQAIAIVVLATILSLAIILFIVLFATGVIRFGGNEGNEPTTSDNGGNQEQNDDNNDKNDDDDDYYSHRYDGRDSDAEPIDDDSSSGKTSQSRIINNTHKQVKENGTLVKVGDLEFYLPNKFKAGGKNKDGAYTYNLTNDDGWAQVLVYAENSTLTPATFITKRISSYLDITNSYYRMNGTTWVQAENAYALAYATKLDGKVYAVYYSVKLDSDAASKAMQMIPKTLYMKRIYSY